MSPSAPSATGNNPPGAEAVCCPHGAGPGMTAFPLPMPDDAPRQLAEERPAAPSAPSAAPPLAATEFPKRDRSLQHLTMRAAGGDQEAFAGLHQRLGGGLFRLFM